MRIAIVNDMTLAVKALEQTIAMVPGYEVAWIAFDGKEALEKCRQDRPDVILMDLIMPVMSGAEATRHIMQECPCAILVVTATVDGNISQVYEAMGYGALDAVNTPVLGRPDGASQLLAKIAMMGRLIGTPAAAVPAQPHPHVANETHAKMPPLVAIGASTGGPRALYEIISRLPADFNAAVVIVQHVDRVFADGLAKWLQEESALPIVLADNLSPIKAGSIYIAATNDHIVMTPGREFRYTREPADLSYRPSVNVFFESLVATRYRPGVGVILTGMGRDGGTGLLSLRGGGWHTIAQDETTSVVYGMPKAAVELQAAQEVLPIDKIADSIVAAIRKG